MGHLNRQRQTGTVALIVFVILAAAAGMLCIAGVFRGADDTGTGQDAAGIYSQTAELGLIIQQNDQGLYVFAVSEGGPAARAGICSGDTLLTLNSTPLKTTADVNEILSGFTGVLTFGVERDGTTATVQLQTRK